VAVPAPAVAAPAVAAPAPDEELPKIQKSKAPIAIVAVIVIAVLAAGAYVALRPAPKPAAPPEAPAAPAPARAAKAPEPAPAAAEAVAPQAPAAASPAAAPAPADAAASPTPAATPPPAAAAPTPAPAAPTPATAKGGLPRKSEDADLRRLLASAERKYDTGRFAEAITDYRKAVAIRRTPQALVGLARALYDSNSANEAMKTAEEATREDGRYAPAWLLLGEIHNDKGRIAQSRAAYERYLQLEPRGEAARAVREILAKLPK
jgi:tetratricopeptide (TPR) repeat protein